MSQRHSSNVSGSTLQQQPSDHPNPHDYFYPPIPIPQQPRLAHIDPRKNMSDKEAQSLSRLQGSISSSESSGILSQKQHTPSPDRSWPTATAEHTAVDYDEQRRQHRAQGGPFYHDEYRQHHKRSEATHHTSPAVQFIRDRRRLEEADDHEEEEDHALWVLFWLSILDPVHSLAGCLYTVVVLLVLTLTSPIRLCQKKTSFSDQIVRILAPPFKHHLDMMYASSVEYAFEWDFRVSVLVVMQLMAPMISLGVAIASWITAAFWVFTSIMGNPDGTERRDDGRDAVLSVRNWWERCLLQAIKRQTRSRPQMRAVV